jgi:hypothetical protein
MPRQEAPLEYLGKFIPQAAVPRTLQYLHEYKVHLTITRERRSVLGDFRHATHFSNHRISVNSNLNKYAFLITLVHELAHLVAFTMHGHRIAPHGQEWKRTYAFLLKDFLEMEIFPEEIQGHLSASISDLPASSCSDEKLMRLLMRYDKDAERKTFVEQIPEGGVFQLSPGKLYRKGKKLRKRYQCLELATGKWYLFSPIHEVERSVIVQ